ncbi:MAG: FxLYD domain-containing protein [Vicinamibacterales bacterium]
MDAVLLGITVVSLGVALVMSLVAWRVSRDARARSMARVAALSMDAAAAPPAPARRPAPPPRSVAAARAPWTPAPAPRAVARAPRRGGRPDQRPGTALAELPLHPAPAAPARAMSDGFLAAAPAAGGGRQRGLAVAASVLMVALLALGASMFAGPASPAAVEGMGGTAPLELISLRHDQSGGRLAVSGLVKNPSSGRAVDRLDAVVFLFDQAGTFVKSAVAPVDFRHLAAGDESPFVVTLDAPAGVARYRVSFRTAGGVVPHIDRRDTPATLETRR